MKLKLREVHSGPRSQSEEGPGTELEAKTVCFKPRVFPPTPTTKQADRLGPALCRHGYEITYMCASPLGPLTFPSFMKTSNLHPGIKIWSSSCHGSLMPSGGQVSYLHAFVPAVPSAWAPCEDSVPCTGSFIKTHLKRPLYLNFPGASLGLLLIASLLYAHGNHLFLCGPPWLPC